MHALPDGILRALLTRELTFAFPESVVNPWVTQAEHWVALWKSLGDPVENVGSPKDRNRESYFVCNKRGK
jgi:hypothetical protein